MRDNYISSVLVLAAICTTLASCNCEDDLKDETAFAASVTAATTLQERNALVEHFTGVNDEHSPEGHRILNGLLVTHPERLYCINVHTGIYADNTYITDFGTELAAQSSLTAFPAGTVNRHVFEPYAMDTVNKGTAMPVHYLPNACDIIMGQTSTANIDARAEINASSRELKVAVAIYYTEQDTVNATHKINVALIEDSVWGKQIGGSISNPTQYDFVNGKYCHMHMLRHLVTGQWGDDITPKAGKQIRRVYAYTIPLQICGSDVDLSHLRVLVFLSEGKQEVINVCQARLALV